MSNLLKDIYSPAFYGRLSAILTETVPGFDKKRFIARIFDSGFADKALKERMAHTSQVLHEFLPDSFPKAAKLLEKIIAQLRKNNEGEDSLAYMFLPDYVERYGLQHFDSAIPSLELITQFVSCEFAVRPFILQYGSRMMEVFLQWSLHKNHKVRRLASEGSRPRLPWAMAIPALKKDPAPVLPILENLKNDPSEWVRRSVANNLNDIAKDHPAVVMDIARRWKGISKETDAIIKHGCRTLLKQGHTEVLAHYGLNGSHASISGLKVHTPKVAIGDSLAFSFTVRNDDKAPQTIRLEYGIYYNKSKGQLARKVFKISERLLQPGEQVQILKKQSFKIITTRVFYPGPHQVSVIVNGEEKGVKQFELVI